MVEARRAGTSRHKKTSPPILSHEFVIQNHGDIMSCVLMVFIVGLMFPLTAKFSTMFIAPQYNESSTITVDSNTFELQGYRNGLFDLANIFFYTIAWIVVHAIIQEYVLDKLQRKVHLSKSSTFKFTDSGHLLAFSIYSVVHALILLQDILKNTSDFKRIWIGYPEEHRLMSASLKFFFIFQISYWLHQFPEFYFQKLKKEEMQQKTITSIVYLVVLNVAYFTNFTRIGLVLLVLEYTAQVVFHFARLAYFLDKKSVAKPVFKFYNLFFVLSRLASAALAVMTFWYGLRQSEIPYFDIEAGNFNTNTFRLNIMLSIILLYIYQLWNFVAFHLGRYKESSGKKKSDKKSSSAPIQKKKRNDDSQSESEPQAEPKKANKKKD